MRLGRAAATGLLALGVLLAGCAGSPRAASNGTPPEQAQAFEELGLEATSDRGVIRGVVVDTAIRPLAEVEVRVPGGEGRTAITSDLGVFGFDDLEPGTYFLSAHKPGYHAVQQAVEVEAGVDDPPAVKMVLPRVVGLDPYYNVREWDGFIQCTTSFLVTCGAPNLLTGQNLTSDRYTWTWYFDPNATLIQNEMVWKSSQSLTPTMYFEMEPDGNCEDGFFNRTEGFSPIYATLNESQVAAGPIDDDCGIYFSLFSGHNEPLPRMPGTGWGIGLTVQQTFRMFGHDFHNFLPPEGWIFSRDGDPPVPAT